MERTENLIALLKANGDSEQAAKMSDYMQGKFSFLGIKKPILKVLIRPFLKETAKEKLNFDLINKLWDEDFREAQYVALEYIGKHKKELSPSNLSELKRLIVTKSWWETVDTIDAFVGLIVSKDEALKSVMLDWSTDENLWLRRTAIDFQQEYKEKTDTDLLSEIIKNNLGSREFFINKAIGWSLREYGKVNAAWVKDFVEENKADMSPMSIREATKYI